MNNEKIERDYDKEPIVIKDYNYIFLLLFGVYFIPLFLYFYFYNPGNLTEHTKFVHFFILIPLFILPGFKDIVNLIGKRSIKLTNNSIIFSQESQTIEKININEIKKINKTYQDYYHKSQNNNKNIINLVFSILSKPLYQLILIINKMMFHIKMDGLKSYSFYDSIIIFSDDSFINILATTKKEKEELKEYFQKKKKVDLDKQDVFFKFYYSEDEININKGEN